VAAHAAHDRVGLVGKPGKATYFEMVINWISWVAHFFCGIQVLDISAEIHIKKH
jgi:hypothetical protein